MVLIADSPFTWQWMQISWVFRSVVLPVAGLYLLPHSSICGRIQVFVHVQRPAGPYAPIVLVRIVPVIQKKKEMMHVTFIVVLAVNYMISGLSLQVDFSPCQ
uniref:Uncharacterized protein n=1 Tax=Triticum urartu TaxID=4572 RepID=A0A8R7V1B6_TRIUA